MSIKVSQLTEDSAPTSDDFVLATDNASGASKKVTMGHLVTAGLPTQTSNSGKFLTTNGSSPSWGTVAGGSNVPFVYNVKSDYGAVGNNSTNDTTSIQNAIDAAHAAGGGIVFFPQGTYKITAALSVYTGVTLQGESSESSIINQVTTTEDGLYAMDASSITIEGLLIEGPSTGSGVGINFAWTGAGNVPYLDFKDVWVRHFGSDGIAIETPIVSTFDRVISQGNGGYGFNWYHAGTSCTFNSCWARDNVQAGYHFYESVYQALIACAADGNGMGYLVENAQSIGFYATGAESQVVGTGLWDGTGFKISNSSVVGLHDVWLTGNVGVGIWVTNGSIATEIFGAADNSPGVGATAFVKTDVSTNTTLSDVHNTTANSYSPGTVTVLNDGANNMLTKQMTVKDSSGSMLLTAASDGAGGQFSIQVDTTGILDLFGQGGQTLNVNLLDGYLQLTPLTATTVPYLDVNKRFVSSAVTPTELGYLHGVTTPTGSGALVLATGPTVSSLTVNTLLTANTELDLVGSSGTLKFTAATDGADYNIFITAGGSKTLALYGSSSNTLNLQLLDGFLELDALTATTVPYLDSNKRFASSAVTPTELGYVSGVTSAIQTQLNNSKVLNAAPAAGGSSGTTFSLTSAQTQAIGDVVQINGSGQANLAKADVIANASVVAMATAAVSGSATNTYLLEGVLRLSASPGWTVGGTIYLTTTGTTGNTLTQTAPSGANNVIQILGVALAADTILFKPSLVQVEHV